MIVNHSTLTIYLMDPIPIETERKKMYPKPNPKIQLFRWI